MERLDGIEGVEACGEESSDHEVVSCDRVGKAVVCLSWLGLGGHLTLLSRSRRCIYEGIRIQQYRVEDCSRVGPHERIIDTGSRFFEKGSFCGIWKPSMLPIVNGQERPD
jgi:hypothetical protein